MQDIENSCEILSLLLLMSLNCLEIVMIYINNMPLTKFSILPPLLRTNVIQRKNQDY